MDPSIAAQMAALTAYSPAKLIGGQTTTIPPTAQTSATTASSNASGTSTTTSAPGVSSAPTSLGPSSAPSLSPTQRSSSPAMNQQQQQQQQQHLQQQLPSSSATSTNNTQGRIDVNHPEFKRQRIALANNLANVFAHRGLAPLPPSITGVPNSAYDATTSQYRLYEPQTPNQEPGFAHFAGRDIDLLVLFRLVWPHSSQKLTANNAWSNLLPMLDLPEHHHGQPVTPQLQRLFTLILGPVEQHQRQNTQQRVMEAARQAQARQGQSQPHSQAATPSGGPPLAENLPIPTPTPDESISDGLKRKMTGEDTDSKRARMKTESLDGEGTEDKYKITYLPLSHEISTYGGRDLRHLETMHRQRTQRLPIHDINQWGTIDVQHLALSIRSRLPQELSFALTTLSYMSVMTSGGQPGSGMEVNRCSDMIDDLIDLLADVAFEEVDVDEQPEPSTSTANTNQETRPWTHRQLVALLRDDATQLFSGMFTRQGAKPRELGPLARPGEIVLTITNIFRNLSCVFANQKPLANHSRLLDVLLRLSCLLDDQALPRALAPTLSLADIITARKDILLIASNLATYTELLTPRRATRSFSLFASFLSDTDESLPPSELVQRSTGAFPNQQSKPPHLVDLALDGLCRLIVPDSNRRAVGTSVSAEQLWDVISALARRLPVSEMDHTLLDHGGAGLWLSYTEKLLLALHALLFASPPDVKKRAGTPGVLGLPKTILRLVRRWTGVVDPAAPPRQQRPDARQLYAIAAFRAVEVLRVVDDAADEYGSASLGAAVVASGAMLSFGMGYGEGAENELKPGCGLLGGYQEEVVMGVMMRDMEVGMFHELESLVRVE